jgi:hypothetical protein
VHELYTSANYLYSQFPPKDKGRFLPTSAAPILGANGRRHSQHGLLGCLVQVASETAEVLVGVSGASSTTSAWYRLGGCMGDLVLGDMSGCLFFDGGVGGRV